MQRLCEVQRAAARRLLDLGLATEAIGQHDPLLRQAAQMRPEFVLVHLQLDVQVRITGQTDMLFHVLHEGVFSGQPQLVCVADE
jgi:hypothetical protein